MSTITLQEAQTRLPEILQRLLPGQEITITNHGVPLAQVRKTSQTAWPCQPGSAAGKVWMSPDFDAPLEDFKEYIE